MSRSQDTKSQPGRIVVYATLAPELEIFFLLASSEKLTFVIPNYRPLVLTLKSQVRAYDSDGGSSLWVI